MGEKSNQKASTGCGGLIGIVVIAIILYNCAGHSSSDSNSQTASTGVSSTAQTTTKAIIAGQSVTFKSRTFVATSKDDYDHLLNFVNSNNSKAIGNMIANSQVVVPEQGTQADVLDVTFTGTANIEISDGPLQGTQGFVPVEFLTPSK